MPSTNENVEGPSIEKVFHSINTRLNNIKMGITDLGNSYSGDEYGYRISDSIDVIRIHIQVFTATKALNATYYPLSLIERIQELIETNLNIPVVPQPDDSWAISQINDFTKIKEELSEYKLFLEAIQYGLFDRIDVEGNTSPNNDRIKINITVEQLGALIYFLNNNDDFKKNEKIFNAELKSLCLALSSILCLPNGETISPKSMNNNSSSFKKNIASLTFWKEKFISYTNQSNLLIGKIDE